MTLFRDTGAGLRHDHRVHHARSPDTSPDAERVQVELLQRAGAARRYALCCSLTSSVVRLSRQALREQMPGSSEREVLVRWVELNYGSELAAGVARRLGVAR